MPKNAKPKPAIKRASATKFKSQPASLPTSSGPRRLSPPKQSWQNPLGWRQRQPVPAYKPLPKARHMFLACLQQLWAQRQLFAGIVLVYGLLNLLLVRGLSGSSDLSSIKNLLNGNAAGFVSQLGTSFGAFLVLLGTSGSSNNATSGVFQSLLLIVSSLALIWALRQVSADRVVRVRDSFYQGMYPLVPFVLIFMLMGLQLLPLGIGGGLYSMIVSNGIAVRFWEQAVWLILFMGLALWSLRMLTASVFALYIVTLPDMAPLRAYRSARKLVYGRRLLIWRKIIFLPVVLLMLAAAIELPLIFLITPVAAWVFFIFSMAALPVTHSYLYNLYRELL